MYSINFKDFLPNCPPFGKTRRELWWFSNYPLPKNLAEYFKNQAQNTSEKPHKDSLIWRNVIRDMRAGRESEDIS